jgi:hypothetical protein
MKILPFVLLFGVLPVAAAHAQNAEEMASNCKEIVKAKVSDQHIEAPPDIESGICWGAFLSFQEAIRYSGYEYPDRTPSPTPIKFFGVCASEATTSQLVKVFVHYTEQHPEQLHKDFFQVALDAGREAFPCKSAP